ELDVVALVERHQSGEAAGPVDALRNDQTVGDCVHRKFVLASENAISTGAEQSLDKPAKTRNSSRKIQVKKRPPPSSDGRSERSADAAPASLGGTRRLPARAALAPQARCDQPDQDAAEEHARTGEKPVLATVARELRILHDEPIDPLLCFGGTPLELLVLVANRDDVRRRRTDIGELFRGVVAPRGGAFELGSGSAELLRQAGDLGLELADAAAGLLE